MRANQIISILTSKRGGPLKKLLLLVILNFSVIARAEVVKFSEEELARESVLPKFKEKHMVLNRAVTVAKKISVGGGAGLVLNEPFNNPWQYGGFVNYHLSEASAINVLFNMWASGNSTYSDQLDSGSTNFGLKYRTKPQYVFLTNFQYTAYYGKISLSKLYVMNLMLYGLAGGGTINFGGKNFLAFDIGIGQKFYFTPKIALRVDLRSLIYNGPNVVGVSGQMTSDKSPDYFPTTLTLSNLLYVGLEFLFK